jgi:hypothetical protein
VDGATSAGEDVPQFTEHALDVVWRVIGSADRRLDLSDRKST